ncbi:MAG: 50S ribosomal protein L22 [Candidatus Lambdaproteobacteria bacterium]|nr:50S ribosomal protein L22 [Candidatus Lambdaproteobacteria bacterium]
MAHAILKGLRISPRKARLVVDLIRGRNVTQALGILENTNKRSAPHVRALLKSAVANAQEKAGGELDVDGLKVQQAMVDVGPTLKRFRPRAMGRATPIRKRTCRITVVVG